MLVHTRPDQKEAIFLSFPRDLWVDIPGMGMGRINSAFEGGIDHGGAQRVSRTVGGQSHRRSCGSVRRRRRRG